MDEATCDWCEEDFEWDDSDYIEWHDEYNDGTPFTVWECECPHCGGNTRVRQW